MSGQHIPGLSIAISIDTVIVWENGYGFADLENFVPVTTSTKFRSASIGKPMTATAIMQLNEKGLLDLNDQVQKYYDFPLKKWPITIQQLLMHQSGIRTYRDSEVVNTRHYNNISDALIIFKDDSLIFKPGANYSYTSFNYNLLGCVLEKAAKMEYMTYMINHVFKPAKMNNTVFDDCNSVITNRARGYRYDSTSNEIINARLHDPSDRVPAGGFLTTANDLVSFSISVYSGRIIREKSFMQMIENPKLSNGSFTSYGLGWGCYEPNDKFYGYTEIFHGGQTPGVSNMLTIFISPAKKISIAIMTNREGMNRRGDICEEIAKVVLDIKEELK